MTALMQTRSYLPEARTLPLVRFERVGDVGCRSPSEGERVRHGLERCRRACTSCHDTFACSLGSARRRSSSSRCHCGTPTSPASVFHLPSSILHLLRG